MPTAFIGLAAPTDGIGPTGWRGFAELFGWIVVCAASSYRVGLLLTPRGWPKAWRYLAGIAVAGTLTLAIDWLGLSAPVQAKIAFTSALQMVGATAVIGCVVLLTHFVRDGRKC